MMGSTQHFDDSDPRSKVAQEDDERQRKVTLKKRQEELLKQTGDVVKAAQQLRVAEEEGTSADILKYVALAFAIVLAVGITSVYGIMWVLDNFT